MIAARLEPGDIAPAFTLSDQDGNPVALSDFVDEAHHTGSLFASEDRSKSLYSTVDKLNARFGKQAVYFASGHKARDRGGMHIAFNHIPDPKTDK